MNSYDIVPETSDLAEICQNARCNFARHRPQHPQVERIPKSVKRFSEKMRVKQMIRALISFDRIETRSKISVVSCAVAVPSTR
ncbi:hypothetical protein DK867_14115 [Ochrobactrum sp. POC9]|nr:hypothetical protein DK867_14115 [Ochrobactrum sp. POC9]